MGDGNMLYKKWQVCVAIISLLLCGCSQRAVSVLADVGGQQAGEQAGAEDGREKAGKTENKFPVITVIDVLPEVDETVPRELTPLPSSEIINIIGQKEIIQHVRQEDGSVLDDMFSVYHVACHDHDVSFAMPKGGQIIWRGSGVSVQYEGERERRTLQELDEKNVTGDDCEEFNESMARTRQLIAGGFLQDEFVKYLSQFPELQLEDTELILELVNAQRTDRTDDNTS